VLPRGDSSIEVTSQGSIGLDERLDLQITIRLPLQRLGDTALGNRLATKGLVAGVSGTLDEPQIELPETIKRIRSAADALLTAALEVLGGLIERNRQRETPLLNEPPTKPERVEEDL
jgi:hypothetical protein